jgi:hypothetical protein
MKKIYFLTSLALITAKCVLAQNGITGYSLSIAGTTINTGNINYKSAFVIDNTGNKWIGFNAGTTTSFQLIRFNGTQWDTFPAFNAISATNKVNALAVDAANHIWIGSNAGLTVYNGTSFTTYNTSNSGIVSDVIISLACGNNCVYIGTTKGLSVFDGTTFTNYNRANNGMKSDTVNCIASENAIAIWLGNPYGLDKFNGSNFSFNYTAPSDNINCIYIDALNNKWLGTTAHGVIKYDNTNFYTMQQLYPSNTSQDLIGVGGWPTIVKSICKGPNGGVLFGTIQRIIPTGNYSTNIGSIEITANQLYFYSDLNLGIAYLGLSHYEMQHDVGSNKIFYTAIGAGASLTSPFLYSFDNTQYSDALDVSPANSDFLDINNVNALITDNSQINWDNTSGRTRYFTPKQNNTSPLNASAMWIGGYATPTDLRVAAMTYRQNGYDFWPGPLNPSTDSITMANMLAYNKVWKVNRYDIANFIYNWNAGNVQNGTYYPTTAIATWPGNSPYNGQPLAPYVDVDNDGNYNYTHGDYPLIKGDQMIWSVYNDNFGKHTETKSINNIRLEVQSSAYAFTCPSVADSDVVLNNTTFYNYKIVNRGNTQLSKAFISLWIDTDLGNYQDDYIGCDVMNDFGYTYNGDNYDEDTDLPGYHSNLPVFACNILSGPLADASDGIDNNHNCVIDEPGEKCLMSGFTYYINSGASLNGNPNGYAAYYNLMSGNWETGAPMTYGNQGLNATSGTNPVCKYLFPGTSDPYGFGLGGNCNLPVVPPAGGSWTEGNIPNNPPGDRRFMVNVGPFTMQPAGIYQLDYALVFTQDSIHCDSNNTCPITRAVQDNKRVKQWFNSNAYPSCLSLSGLGIQQNNAPSLNIKLYPNPANTTVYIEFPNAQRNVTIEVFDMLGKVVRGFQYTELDKYATIPVSDLPSSVYTVKITSASGLAITKFVKE